MEGKALGSQEIFPESSWAQISELRFSNAKLFFEQLQRSSKHTGVFANISNLHTWMNLLKCSFPYAGLSHPSGPFTSISAGTLAEIFSHDWCTNLFQVSPAELNRPLPEKCFEMSKVWIHLMPHCCHWSKIHMKSDAVGSSFLILSQATSHWELHLERNRVFSTEYDGLCPVLERRLLLGVFRFESWQYPNKLWGYSPNDMQGSLSEESWKWTFALVLQGSHPHPPNRPNRPRLCADWSGPQGHQPQTHPTSGGFSEPMEFGKFLNPRRLFRSLTWWPGRMPKSRMWSSWRVHQKEALALPIMGVVEAYWQILMKFVSFSTQFQQLKQVFKWNLRPQCQLMFPYLRSHSGKALVPWRSWNCREIQRLDSVTRHILRQSNPEKNWVRWKCGNTSWCIKWKCFQNMVELSSLHFDVFFESVWSHSFPSSFPSSHCVSCAIWEVFHPSVCWRNLVTSLSLCRRLGEGLGRG